MSYWYDIYISDEQEPYNGNVPLLKEQAYREADRLYADGWSVCVIRMEEDGDGEVREVKRTYWPPKHQKEVRRS